MKTRRTCELCKKRVLSVFRTAWINKISKPPDSPYRLICQKCYDKDVRVVR